MPLATIISVMTTCNTADIFTPMMLIAVSTTLVTMPTMAQPR